MIEPEQARGIVQVDVESALREALPIERDGHGFRIHEGFEWILDTPIGNFNVDRVATAVSIPWQWTGIHRDDLLGFPPQIGEERELTVSGLTVVQEVERSDHAPDGVVLTRFVDWMQTLLDLGARAYVRPVIDVRRREVDIDNHTRLRDVLTEHKL